jgi:glucokinase
MTPDAAELPILAADVGGTNLNLALMAGGGPRPRLLKRGRFPTASVPSIVEPVRTFLASCALEGLPGRVQAACVAAAGPVEGRRIPITNAPWDVDAEALEAELGARVRLLNDFAAVAHGVLLLDPADPAELLPIPHGDGSLPAPAPRGTVLLVGAGTGLGVGYVTREDGTPRVHPSEGGHIGLPITGEESFALWRHLRERYPGPPGAEAAVSGRGIANIFEFLVASGRCPETGAAREILALGEEERPAAVARSQDPASQRAMELFVELYARVCAELAAVFLPRGGLYLAGGIPAKNAPRFLEGGRFMAAFERNYRSHIDALACATPVFIVQDYAVSLFGAASAALKDF